MNGSCYKYLFNSILQNKNIIKADSTIDAVKLYRQKRKRLQIISGHSGIYDQLSPITYTRKLLAQGFDY